MDMDVGPLADDSAKRLDLPGIESHEVIFRERRVDQQRIQWTAWDHLPAWCVTHGRHRQRMRQRTNVRSASGLREFWSRRWRISEQFRVSVLTSSQSRRTSLTWLSPR